MERSSLASLLATDWPFIRRTCCHLQQLTIQLSSKKHWNRKSFQCKVIENKCRYACTGVGVGEETHCSQSLWLNSASNPSGSWFSSAVNWDKIPVLPVLPPPPQSQDKLRMSGEAERRTQKRIALSRPGLRVSEPLLWLNLISIQSRKGDSLD